jgi:hypothetical protein
MIRRTEMRKVDKKRKGRGLIRREQTIEEINGDKKKSGR